MKAKITYARLQERVAAAAGITRKEAWSLLKEMTAAVSAGLVADGKVNIAGLGRFSRKAQRARTGRNPQTGEPLQIPEKSRVAFLPEAQWRRAVNRDYDQMPIKPAPRPQAPAVNIAAALPPQEVSSDSRTRPVDPPKIVHPAPPEPTEPQPPPVVVAAGRATRANPPQPVETDIETPMEDIPVPPPVNALSNRRKKKKAVAIALVLIAAAALFLLWPRPLAPPVSSRPEPVRMPPPLPETLPSSPSRPAAAEKAAVSEAPITVPDVESTRAIPPAAISKAPVPVTSYRVAPGDSLWKISDEVYHYAYFWPIIFHANQTALQHPDTLIVGIQLAIPVFKGRIGVLDESEFQQLADGYLRVYQVYQRHHHPRAPYYLWVAYRLRAHWVSESDLILGRPEDLEFIRLLKGRSLIQ